uniref:Putative zinc-finger domain-containing protein n=1 Tax=Lygus hesperus TaxID=30085 RepID=A0A0A9WMP0_LYGHE
MPIIQCLLDLHSVSIQSLIFWCFRQESAVVSRENEDENSLQSSQGTSHLPAWQQEEFERQKRIMVKKESVIAAAREKIRAKQSLVVGTASEKLTKKDSSPPPSEELNKTDSVSHVGEADPTTTDPPQKTEETKDGCDLSSLNTAIADINLQVDSVVSSDSDGLNVQNEVKSCMEFIISKVCGETESLRTSTETSTEVTSDFTASADSSNSVTVSHHDSQLSYKSVPSNPESSESSKPNTANISSLLVSPLKNPKLPVSRPAVLKASANVASSTQGLSSQQMKKLLQKRMSEFNNPVSSPNSASRAATKLGKDVAPIKSAVRESVKPTIQKKSQLPVMTNAKQHVNSLPNAVANAAVGKSLFAVKDSSYALKGLNEMTDLVAGLENGMTEYRNLRKDFIAQRKQLMLTQQKISKKRQQLLEMKDTIENKKRLLQSTISMDTSSLSPLPDTRDQPKQSTRASELLTLKFKEVCLKAQFAMMGLETASRPQAAVKMSRPAEDLNHSPRKKMKLKVRPPVTKLPLEPALSSKVLKTCQSECTDPGTTHKLVVSVRDKDKMDPLIPLCPYDIKGVCKDEECEYQHLKN